MELKNQLLSILEVSASLTIPKHTLRFWEKEFAGMLVPGRTRGGQRRYAAEDVALLEKIKRLRARGQSLSAIKRTLLNTEINKKHTKEKKIDLLAARVTKVVMMEIASFFEGEKHLAGSEKSAPGRFDS